MQRHDFRDYGPAQRRGQAKPQRNMATPYTGRTAPLPAYQGGRGRPQQLRPPSTRGRRWVLVLVCVLLAAVGAATYGGMHYLDQRYSGRIYPNVTLQSVDLTEKTPAEAEQAVRTRFDAFLANPVTFEFAGKSWQPSAADVGISVDVRGQVAAALRAGRGNSFLQNLRQLWSISQQGYDLPLKVSVDGPKLQAYLRQITKPLEQAPVEAALTIDPVTGALSATDSSEGRMVLLDDTVTDVVQHVGTLASYTVPIRTQTMAPVLNSNGIAEARRTVEAMTQGPLHLMFQKQEAAALQPMDIANMVAISRVDGTTGLQLNAQLDQKQLRKWVTKLAAKIGRDSVEPRVDWNGGNLKITQPGRSAYQMDIDRAVTRINEAIVGSGRSLDLPVNEVQPKVTPETLGTLGIKELVSTGQSDFTGSAAYRITNIKAGVNLINGILIAPGGEFSFDDNVPAIDPAHGFTDGYAIVGDRTQLEPGGGICQVSTTLFRAAFYAGMPFSDWTPHRFRISWYEKYDTIGMDATIFTGGGPDLRFVNNTDHWMLIQGTVDEPKALMTFQIYGTKVPGMVVQRTQPEITNQTPAPTQAVYVDDPKQPVGSFHQTDSARGGMDIRIDRIILQDGQVKNQRSFLTKFAPWPNIFVKNPQTPLPPGGKLGSS
ncbi:MAG: VanW family protein [Herpetosiphonaceae bacterium]|nr:VanW family protein [Herpetosiphonaceae bacterium]